MTLHPEALRCRCYTHDCQQVPPPHARVAPMNPVLRLPRLAYGLLLLAALSYPEASFGAQQSSRDPVYTTSAADTPLHIADVDGAAAVFDRNGIEEAAIVNAPVLPGDRVTTLAGRV